MPRTNLQRTYSSLSSRIIQEKQRTKNRIREHNDHEWVVFEIWGDIVLMDCPCGWIGWMPSGSVPPAEL